MEIWQRNFHRSVSQSMKMEMLMIENGNKCSDGRNSFQIRWESFVQVESLFNFGRIANNSFKTNTLKHQQFYRFLKEILEI